MTKRSQAEYPEQGHGAVPDARLSRRAFLKSAGAALAGGLLAACAGAEVSEESWQAGEFWRTPTPENLVLDPLAPTPEGTPAPEGLAAFLALSSVLTGFDNLDPGVGAIYLRALQESPEFSGGLQGLYERAGVSGGQAPASIEALESTGVFAEEGSHALADRIIELWYTGIYPQGEEQAVATFVDALAWKAINFTKPPSICGKFGFWAERPQGEY